MTLLTGHTTPETAYVVEDYPYGFRLRTSIRYWIETKEGHGQRMISQTLNPKTGRWNAPNASTYDVCLSLTLDPETGYVSRSGLNGYSKPEEIDAYEAAIIAANAEDSYTREAIRYLRAMRRAESRITWTVTSHICTCRPDCPGCIEAGPRQTLEEQNRIIKGLIREELWQDTAGAITAG